MGVTGKFISVTLVLIFLFHLTFAAGEDINLALDCDFDSDMCNYKNVKSHTGVLYWTREAPGHKGSAMHLKSKAQYLHEGTLQSGNIPQGTGRYCLQFWYYMTEGSLNVKLNEASTTKPTMIWKLSGSQGNTWQMARAHFEIKTANTTIQFIGDLSGTKFSDIAIDGIAVTNSSGCPSMPDICDFDSGFCSWKTSQQPRFSVWTRQTYIFMGFSPSKDHTKNDGNGFFVALQNSTQTKSQSAVLTSPVYQFSYDLCIDIFYRMYSETSSGTLLYVDLILQCKDSNGGLENVRKRLWELTSTEKMNDWNEGRIPVSHKEDYYTFQVEIVGITGTSPEDVIALDDVSLIYRNTTACTFLPTMAKPTARPTSNPTPTSTTTHLPTSITTIKPTNKPTTVPSSSPTNIIQTNSIELSTTTTSPKTQTTTTTSPKTQTTTTTSPNTQATTTTSPNTQATTTISPNTQTTTTTSPKTQATTTTSPNTQTTTRTSPNTQTTTTKPVTMRTKRADLHAKTSTVTATTPSTPINTISTYQTPMKSSTLSVTSASQTAKHNLTTHHISQPNTTQRSLPRTKQQTTQFQKQTSKVESQTTQSPSKRTQSGSTFKKYISNASRSISKSSPSSSKISKSATKSSKTSQTRPMTSQSETPDRQNAQSTLSSSTVSTQESMTSSIPPFWRSSSKQRTSGKPFQTSGTSKSWHFSTSSMFATPKRLLTSAATSTHEGKEWSGHDIDHVQNSTSKSTTTTAIPAKVPAADTGKVDWKVSLGSGGGAFVVIVVMIVVMCRQRQNKLEREKRHPRSKEWVELEFDNVIYQTSVKPDYVDVSPQLEYQDDSRRPSHQDDSRRPSHQDDSRRPSQREDSRRPSHRDDSRRPSYQDDSRRPSHQDDSRRPSHQDDSRRPSLQDDSRRPSHRDDSRRPSHQDYSRRQSHQDDSRRPSHPDDSGRPSHHIVALQPSRPTALPRLSLTDESEHYYSTPLDV